MKTSWFKSLAAAAIAAFTFGFAPSAQAGTVTLTQANIFAAGTSSTQYRNVTMTTDDGYKFTGYALIAAHSGTTSDKKYCQINTYASKSTYVQIPAMPGPITNIAMTVSNTQQPMGGGGNTKSLSFCAENGGTAIASATGSSKVSINLTGNTLKTGYINASGGVRIWDITVSYAEPELPTITGVKALQRYPWNGMVDIAYELSDDMPAGYALKVQAADLTTGDIFEATAVTAETAPLTKGAHTLTWDMNADGYAFVSTNVSFTVVAAAEPAAGEWTKTYVVVDLSKTPYAYEELDEVPEGGWTDEHKTTKLVLRRIEPGLFTMGVDKNQYPSFSAGDDTPHTVMLTSPYYIGVFEVTQKQWEQVMGTRPSYFTNETCYATRPVENVTYEMLRGKAAGADWPKSGAVDETSFMGVFRRGAGLSDFDLPTEAQWEYACRAGTQTLLNSGKDPASAGEQQDANLDEVARNYYNCGKDAKPPRDSDTAKGTAAVGSYGVNAWGLYDMHGNVWDWCLDWYGGDYGAAPAVDPRGAKVPAEGNFRILRGGSWLNKNVSEYTSPCRGGGEVADDNMNCGIRMVRTLRSSVGGASEPTALDLRTGVVRDTAATETLTYTTNYVGAGVSVDITVNGEAWQTGLTGTGTVEWKPSLPGLNELAHIVKAADGSEITNLVARFYVATPPTVEVYPQDLKNTASVQVFTNDVEVTGDPFVVFSNAMVTVVYTAEEGTFFADGRSVAEATFQATDNPQYVPSQLLPAYPKYPVAYRVPVYVTPDDPASGIDRWETREVTNYTFIAEAGAVLGSTASDSWYVSGTNDVELAESLSCDGTNHLVLCDGDYTLAVPGIYMGNARAALTIYGQAEGTGKLISESGREVGAGIGGGYPGGAGNNITINGGCVTARGTYIAAAIGGGDGGDGRNITINGGEVVLEHILKSGYGGSSEGAAIGGGSGGAGENITINGGTIVSHDASKCPRIGSGSTGGASTNICIRGGTISLAKTIVTFIGSGWGAHGVGLMEGANVYFNLDESAPTPTQFVGRVIRTLPVQLLDEKLMTGVTAAWPEDAKTFTLTNETGSVTIEVGGKDVAFAGTFCRLAVENEALRLLVRDPAITITQQPQIENDYTIAATTDATPGITNYAWMIESVRTLDIHALTNIANEVIADIVGESVKSVVKETLTGPTNAVSLGWSSMVLPKGGVFTFTCASDITIDEFYGSYTREGNEWTYTPTHPFGGMPQIHAVHAEPFVIENFQWHHNAYTTVAEGPEMTTFPKKVGLDGSNYLCRVACDHLGVPYAGDSAVFTFGKAEPCDDCVTVASAYPFRLDIAKKNWDGLLEWSTNKVDWTELGVGTIQINLGEGGVYSLYVRGDKNNTVISKGQSGTWWLTTTPVNQPLAVSGNIETLRGATGDEPSPTAMGESCYDNLFYGSKITTAPTLPATTLAKNCYKGLFASCQLLETAPELPATELAEGCYEEMFKGCDALKDLPELPATTLQKSCYKTMFNACKGLEIYKTPYGRDWKVPATAGASEWNSAMFTGTIGDFATSGDPALNTTYYVRSSQTGEKVQDGIYLYDLGDGTYSINGTGTLTETEALKSRGITNLVLGVTAIGDEAFLGWRSIRDVQAAANCLTVGVSAFEKCYNVTNMAFAATGKVTVKDYAFLRCNSLETLTFSGDASFGTDAFMLMTGIYMKGGMPKIYPIPQVTVAGYTQKLYGTMKLEGEQTVWTEITTEQQKTEFRFFKIKLVK